MKLKISQALKNKFQHLGLDAKVYEGVADSLAATNLITDENLETAIAGAEPALKSFQAEIDRRTTDLKKENEGLKKANLKKEEGAGNQANLNQGSGSNQNEATDIKAIINEALSPLTKEITALKSEKALNQRKELLTKKLDGIPDWQKSKIIKDFERMNFETDEDFNTYLDETDNDVKSIKQEMANEGLRHQSPLFGNGGAQTKEPDPDVKKYVESKQKQNAGS